MDLFFDVVENRFYFYKQAFISTLKFLEALEIIRRGRMTIICRGCGNRKNGGTIKNLERFYTTRI